MTAIQRREFLLGVAAAVAAARIGTALPGAGRVKPFWPAAGYTRGDLIDV